jgi:HTH-type transcriptional regulator/antitoxin HigA
MTGLMQGRSEMENIRPLKTEADYDWALAEIEAYFDRLPEPGSPEADGFDVLTELVGAYETRHWPIEDIDPIEFLDGFMQNHGYGRGDLAAVLGSLSRASEIMLKRRPLTLGMIQKLSRDWHISAEALIKPYRAESPGSKLSA